MKKALAFLVMVGLSMVASATTLTYVPVNPNFGGNPANASGLLSEANAQNGTHAPSKSSGSGSGSATSTSSQLTNFVNTLQAAILNRLTTSVVSEVVDSNGRIKPGVLTTNNFTIRVVDSGGGNVTITTHDNTTGKDSTFTVSQTPN